MHTNWLHDLAQASLGDFDVSDELDVRLSALALRARTNDNAKLELLKRLAWKIERFVWRFRTWDLDPFDLDDVVQEAYLVYLDTLHRWKPRRINGAMRGYLPYFLKVFPLWLASSVRNLKWRTRPPAIHATCQALVTATDDVALLDGFCRNLSPHESSLMQLRVMRGFTIPHAARILGIPRRTAYRRWHRILELGREYLGEAG